MGHETIGYLTNLFLCPLSVNICFQEIELQSFNKLRGIQFYMFSISVTVCILLDIF